MRTLVEEFNKEMDEAAEGITLQLINNHCETIEDYRALTHSLKSIRLSQETLTDILRKRLGEDDDEESDF